MDMDSTPKRFSKGVHYDGKCGKNTSGYAAISSAMGRHDVHELDSNMMSSNSSMKTKEKKKAFYNSDILAYLLLKVVCESDFQSVYVILLSSNTFMSSTIEGMVTSMTEAMSTVILVHHTNDEFYVKSISNAGDSTCVFSVGSELVSFFKMVSNYVCLTVMVYPDVTVEYKSIVSIDNVQFWCVPATRLHVYVSENGDAMYKHNVFPWSRYPNYSGFTIGRGKIRDATTPEKHKFVASFNYYAKMISSVPYRDSCVDCYVLGIVANMIDLMVDRKIVDRSNRLSSSSLEALAELDRKILEIMQSS